MADKVGEYTSPVRTYASLWLLVIKLLRKEEHYGKIYSFDDLSAILKATINNDNDVCNAELLQDAFQNGGITKYAFNISMHAHFENDDSIAIVSLSERIGSARIV
jgi:hypothetical protein